MSPEGVSADATGYRAHLLALPALRRTEGTATNLLADAVLAANTEVHGSHSGRKLM